MRFCAIRSAGWSSLVARRAHNPEVVGSNPAPATNKIASQTHSLTFSFAKNRPNSWANRGQKVSRRASQDPFFHVWKIFPKKLVMGTLVGINISKKRARQEPLAHT